ncbi:MAG: D-glycero-beta-D-manno-heptose-7-phosphate kinase [Crocinitomicaceae bacterium]|nr:D-glycero-beta-D-manno-heptose-7-phosphate kinase [Flavobacteriia bacterium]NDC27793.1 D-glycero-beta-D-manno-heptose-7-phosphate kinase [Crocinitomicaceae bacterium]NDC92603.1 D-glycero-beta-D-manno-heptose-7-phosphate kinase [Flavobacteriales bacterium]
MLDAYVMGKVNRISPEAPVPIVSLENEDARIGGAGNVALNLLALGAKPIICGVIGEDTSGDKLLNLFEKNGISTDGLVKSMVRKTTVKTRVISNKQQLLRIDSESTFPLLESEEIKLNNTIQNIINQGIDGIIFEDYNKGVLTDSVIQNTIKIAKEKDIPTAVDPKKENFLSYKGVSLFKPNLKELKEGLNLNFDFNTKKELFEKGIELLEEKLQNEISFVTLSENGVFIKNQTEKYYVPAHMRSISDVSGAGDTVIAVATLCLISGASTKQIAEISNLAGGLVCEKSGVVSISKNDLLKEVSELLS